MGCRQGAAHVGRVMHMDTSVEKPRRSGLAIAGLVVGVIALLTSLMPIINNASFFVALVGAALAIAGLVGCMRGKRAGKGLAIAAVAVNVLAVVAVLASQSMYGAAIDDAMNGPQVVDTAEDASGDGTKDGTKKDDAQKDEGDKTQESQALAVGAQAKLENGLVVSVDEVTPGLTNYDGSAVTCVHVTYANEGTEAVSFNTYDWKGENASGVRSDTTYFGDASEPLSYGDLAAGGTVTGNLYFDGELSSVLYFSNVLADEPAATWAVA